MEMVGGVTIVREGVVIIRGGARHFKFRDGCNFLVWGWGGICNKLKSRRFFSKNDV